MKKIRSKKGFTLAELLIVVAIIAVLVAVSIPIFVVQLEKSRESTDLANLRAAKAAAVSTVLAGQSNSDIYKNLVAGTAVYYDAWNGVLTTAKPSQGYGKGTTTVGDSANDNDALNYKSAPSEDYTDKVITITYTANTNTFAFDWA